ncbi:DUF488 family protein [Acetobacter sp. LMG 1636]|uniref:DUF488 family protein n=1 Tax=Acetobacter fallax TaxID=1737473 RepID=A0ABX0KF21_9PROT|nr:DUF488 family protein [Acetobacter fallax]NHO37638.1 DUF488 family protein [Acetobacter fallax]
MRIRRIYDPPMADDGARILVDRLWPRGISKERADLTLWLKAIAPSDELRRWFGHDPERWTEFQARYRLELQNNPESVENLKSFVKNGPVTLLYGARDTEHNEAVVLCNFLQGGLQKE